MCLSALGYDVRNMCFLDFYKARGVTAKLIYLKSVLEWILDNVYIYNWCNIEIEIISKIN